MNPNRPARLNRTVLAMLGLLLLLTGAFVLLVGSGAAPTVTARLPARADVPMLPDGFVAPAWLPWIGLAAAVVVGLAALWWLVAQTARAPATGTWQLADDPRGGTTELDTATAAAPLAEEISTYAGVRAATARLGRRPSTPPAAHARHRRGRRIPARPATPDRRTRRTAAGRRARPPRSRRRPRPTPDRAVSRRHRAAAPKVGPPSHPLGRSSPLPIVGPRKGDRETVSRSHVATLLNRIETAGMSPLSSLAVPAPSPRDPPEVHTGSSHHHEDHPGQALLTWPAGDRARSPTPCPAGRRKPAGRVAGAPVRIAALETEKDELVTEQAELVREFQLRTLVASSGCGIILNA